MRKAPVACGGPYGQGGEEPVKKETYFQTLYKLLRKLPENDRQTTVAFYREIVEDRMENGLSEEAAVASLGDVHQLAQKILLENPQRRSSTKPLWIALGVTMAVLVGMGALVTCGVLTYRELRTSSVAEPIGPMEDSIPSSQLPEGAVQGEKVSTPPSEEGQTEKHMEEYRTSVEEVDVVEVDAENKQILFESSEEEELVILQRNILDKAAEYVKPRGVLIFSTCTIAKEENEENMMWFMNNHPFKLESIDEFVPDELKSETTSLGYLQLLPGVHGTDGFFMAKFRRK